MSPRPTTLESDKLIYRLSYADAQHTASYANSHWTMAPSQLLTQRLRGALSLARHRADRRPTACTRRC